MRDYTAALLAASRSVRDRLTPFATPRQVRRFLASAPACDQGRTAVSAPPPRALPPGLWSAAPAEATSCRSAMQPMPLAPADSGIGVSRVDKVELPAVMGPAFWRLRRRLSRLRSDGLLQQPVAKPALSGLLPRAARAAMHPMLLRSADSGICAFRVVSTRSNCWLLRSRGSADLNSIQPSAAMRQSCTRRGHKGPDVPYGHYVLNALRDLPALQSRLHDKLPKRL